MTTGLAATATAVHTLDVAYNKTCGHAETTGTLRWVGALPDLAPLESCCAACFAPCTITYSLSGMMHA